MSGRGAQVQTISVKDLPEEKYIELGNYVDQIEEKKGSLINVLYKAQELFGFLPREVQLFVARKMGIPGSEVFGVVSFYSNFTTMPKGKFTISVCMGTACFVRGAGKVLDKIKKHLKIEDGETSKDGLFTLEDIRCVGACGLAPVVMVNDKIYGRVDEDEVIEIIESYKKGDADDVQN